jgi:hypothetical protein
MQVYGQQNATISETNQVIKTYPFRIPIRLLIRRFIITRISGLIGFALNASEKEWKVIVMENDYI